MKIKCLKILTHGPVRKNLGNRTDHLTVGENYIVLDISFTGDGRLLYRVETDFRGFALFEADQFEVISNYIPSNWEVIIKTNEDNSYYFKLAPKNWSCAPFSFYEEITEVSWPLSEWRQYEKIPEVVSLYFQERDLIYREEEEYEKRNS